MSGRRGSESLTSTSERGLRVCREPYDGPAATALVTGVQAEYVTRYGGEDDTPVDVAEFAPPTGVFLVGYLDEGGESRPVACGGIRRLHDDVAEIKRMYVARPYRRRGLSRVMLSALESVAVTLGYREIHLETGRRQPEAMALYASAGYTRIPSYGYYRDSAENACFGKILTDQAPGWGDEPGPTSKSRPAAEGEPARGARRRASGRPCRP